MKHSIYRALTMRLLAIFAIATMVIPVSAASLLAAELPNEPVEIQVEESQPDAPKVAETPIVQDEVSSFQSSEELQLVPGNGVGNPDNECQNYGFDFGIAKYQSGGTTPDTEGASGAPDFTTSVTWQGNSVDWTASPAVAGIVSKEGNDSYVNSGGVAGTINQHDQQGFSHITFCGNQAPAPICGNQSIEAGEQCDDGNTSNGDGCDESCQLEVVEPPVEQSRAVVIAHKIVCDDESYLPNWSGSDTTITSSTAEDFVAEHSEHCAFAEGWNFQWSNQNATNPGDQVADGGAGWTTFGSTAVNGSTATVIDLDGISTIKIRESFQDGYLPFSGLSENDPYSAEMWCNTDVLNYDNYDYIGSPQSGATYYCVAFNVLEEPQQCVSRLDYVNTNGQPIPDQQHSLSDAVIFTSHYIPALGSTTTDAEWDAAADINLDGRISEADYWCAHKYYSTALYECQIDCSNICGNGIVEDGEQCDDENRTNGDGCSASCQLERPEKLYSIHGYKWYDTNEDGYRGCVNDYDTSFDSEVSQICQIEPLLPNWTIFIDEDEDGILDEGEVSQQTMDGEDHYGWYWFENLPAGDYRICEVLPENWAQIYPYQTTESRCHDVSLPDENPLELVISENAVVGPEYNFGNIERPQEELPLVDGYKYNDLNNDGEWDEGEPGLGDWTINLWSSCSPEALDYTNDDLFNLGDAVIFTAYYDVEDNKADVNGDGAVTVEDKQCADEAYASGSVTIGPSIVVATDVTDENGYYSFSPAAGSYWLTETLKEGWTQTEPGGDGVYGPIDVSYGNELSGYLFGNHFPEEEGCQENCGGGGGTTSTGGGGGGITPPAKLTLEKVASPSVVEPGGQTTYTITIKNVGGQVGANLTLEDTLPAGFTFSDGGGIVKSWDWTTIQPQQVITLSYVVNIASDAPTGTYNNIAVASITNGNTVEASAPVDVRGPQVLGESIDTSGPTDENVQVLGFEELPNTSGGFDYLELVAVFIGLLSAAALTLRQFVPQRS